jgi:Sulfotransferase domain
VTPVSKVFCVGFHKTGTTSLHRALEALGLRCKGFDGELLGRYAAGERSSLLTVAESYDALRDWPWPLLYRELADRYRDGRFILTVREPSPWLKSLMRHAKRTGPTEARRIVYGHAMPHGHEERHLEVYRRHNEAVADFFRGRSSFLVLRTEDELDYPPLCRFLELPVPGSEFPHSYRTEPESHG